MLTASGELPRRVTVNFKPVSEGLEQDHPPALVFTDGSVALFIGQFDCFPMDSLSEVRALPADLNNHPVPAARLKFAFRDAAGPVLLDGKRSATGETTGKDTYVFFGATRPVETPDMVGVFDPQLPDWIQASLTRGVPAMIGRYIQELGPLRRFKPTVLVSWEGPTRGLMSREGGALDGLIAMRYAGAGLLKETDEQRHVGLWFIAHEAAHFWLGQTVAYEYARDAWITEGGAELLAFRAVAEIEPEYDPRIPLNPPSKNVSGSRKTAAWRAPVSVVNGAPITPVARSSPWWRRPDRGVPFTSSRAGWSIPTVPMAWCRAPIGWRPSTRRRISPTWAAMWRGCSTAESPTPGNSLRICWCAPA